MPLPTLTLSEIIQKQNNTANNFTAWPKLETQKSEISIESNLSPENLADKLQELKMDSTEIILTKSREEILEERRARKKASRAEKSFQKFEAHVKQIRSQKSQQVQIIDGKFMETYIKLKQDAVPKTVATNGENTQQRNRIKQIIKCKTKSFTISELFALKIKNQPILKPEKLPKAKQIIRVKKKRLDNTRKKRQTKLKRVIHLIRNARKFRFEEHKLKNAQQIETPMVETSPPSMQHSRKFRPYSDNCISPELCAAVEKLLSDLFRFQKRAYDKNEIKARAKKRYVVGFKEVLKNLEAKKLKLLLIAPDLEPSPGEGGIDELVDKMKTLAASLEVPYLFSISRRKIGYILMKKVPVSCVGILSYDGCDENVRDILNILEIERFNYFRAFSNKESGCLK